MEPQLAAVRRFAAVEVGDDLGAIDLFGGVGRHPARQLLQSARARGGARVAVAGSLRVQQLGHLRGARWGGDWMIVQQYSMWQVEILKE